MATRASSDDYDENQWQILHSKRPLMSLSPSPPLSWDTEIDKLCKRTKAIHLSSWILWTLWSTPMVHSDDGYQLQTPHQEEESYNLPWWQSTPIPYPGWNVHDHSRNHQFLRKGGLKAASDKTHFFLRKVNFIGHVISEQEIQPVAKRLKDLQNLKSPESKRDVMKVLGCLGFL